MAMRLLCVSVVWLALPCRAASPDTAQPAPDSNALVASLARVAPARTAYTEVRFSSVLDRPLILRGELEYLGPGKLGKRVDTPYREQTTIVDGEATVQRGERAPRTFSLAQAPELEGFLRGFAALLGGDAAALAHDFDLSSSLTANGWRLLLKPRDSRLARRIVSVEVDGIGSTPQCFLTRETDGDVSALLVDTLAGTTLPPRPVQAQIDALCRGRRAGGAGAR